MPSRTSESEGKMSKRSQDNGTKKALLCVFWPMSRDAADLVSLMGVKVSRYISNSTILIIWWVALATSLAAFVAPSLFIL